MPNKFVLIEKQNKCFDFGENGSIFTFYTKSTFCRSSF